MPQASTSSQGASENLMDFDYFQNDNNDENDNDNMNANEEDEEDQINQILAGNDDDLESTFDPDWFLKLNTVEKAYYSFVLASFHLQAK